MDHHDHGNQLSDQCIPHECPLGRMSVELYIGSREPSNESAYDTNYQQTLLRAVIHRIQVVDNKWKLRV